MVKQHKRIGGKASALLLSVLILAVLLCTGCTAASDSKSVSSTAAEPVTIKIVHTNDTHGRAAYDEEAVVGFERLAALIDKEQPGLVLDAGDTFYGQAFATLEDGAGIAELLRAVPYDAMTPGNHDWNYGKDRLRELEQLSGVPILAGNVTEDGKPFFANDGTLIKTVDGVKIGVVGVFDPEIKDSTAPRNVEGIAFSDDAEQVSDQAESLRQQGCDIVIALSHQLYCEEFVGRIRNVDLFIAGHDHTVLEESYPDADGKMVSVVETGAYFEQVGLLTILYDPAAKKIVSLTETLTDPAAAASLVPNEDVTAVLDTINSRVTAQLTRVAGVSGVELDGRREELRVMETGVGRIVTAAYLEETGADVAFENAGGIRLSKLLPAGNILVQDVIDIAPFGNCIVTKEISGAALLSIVEQSIDIGLQNKVSYDEWKKTGSDKIRWPEENGNYLQFGGMSVVYDPTAPQGERVLSVSVGDKPLDVAQRYIVATNNYISLGKTYQQLADAPELNQYSACDEALLRCLEQGQAWVDAAASKVCLTEGVAGKTEKAA